MKKRLGKLLGAFLCLSMILGLMPSQALQVLAVEEPAPNYLTFTAEEAGSTLTFTWNTEESVEISKDSGKNWSTYTKGTKITLAKVGDSVQFRGQLTKLNISVYINPAFTMTGKIAASGSVTSIKDGNGGNPDTVASGLAGMFMNCASLTKAPELPSKSVANNGYLYMFENCTGLVAAPDLPATTLGYDAYNSMFYGCSNMKTGPSILPATTLNTACYAYMFQDCTSLTKAPELPAMILTQECYRSMFRGCTSLQQIPNLPATKLALDCYTSMFQGCKNLSMTSTKDSSHTLAWTLPNATLPSTSSWGSDWNIDMFKDCTNVKIGTPQLNKTYYQLCRHSYDENGKCTYCGKTKPKTYSVTIIAGEGLTRDPYRGAEQQMVQDKIEDVYYTADEDHYIQDDYPTITKNGITVARYVLEGWGPVVIVSGRPTADTVITLPEASACNVPPSPEPKPNPEKPVMKDGDNGQHIIGKTETLTFRSSAPLDQFVAVFVDDIMVDSSNYELESGSTIVRLKQAFLDTLSKGSHTIAIQSTGGTATANFMVAEASGSGSGNGGENGGTTGTGTGSGTGSTTSAPAEGNTNVQPAGGTQTAQNTSGVTTTMNVTSPETGDASLVSCIVLAIIIVGGFGLMIVELCRAHRMKKNIQS